MEASYLEFKFSQGPGRRKTMVKAELEACVLGEAGPWAHKQAGGPQRAARSDLLFN